ncbi:MAG: GNAT family N-acetyltransferase [Lachnospiraceae bacterium]|jgi:ribosomal protein S18 acetylase RimI-like enzyme
MIGNLFMKGAIFMNIEYTEEKKFSVQDVQDLFLSVGWVSGRYPQRLYKALQNSPTVITAWSGEKLVGLVRLLDDTEMVAFVNYVLVHPDYQGNGIARKMMEKAVEKYKDFLYIEVMPEESKNRLFYQKFGFQVIEDGLAMQICNE